MTMNNLPINELDRLAELQRTRLEYYQQAIEKDGPIIDTQWGPKAHPAVKMEKEAMLLLLAIQRAIRIQTHQGQQTTIEWEP